MVRYQVCVHRTSRKVVDVHSRKETAEKNGFASILPVLLEMAELLGTTRWTVTTEARDDCGCGWQRKAAIYRVMCTDLIYCSRHGSIVKGSTVGNTFRVKLSRRLEDEGICGEVVLVRAKFTVADKLTASLAQAWSSSSTIALLGTNHYAGGGDDGGTNSGAHPGGNGHDYRQIPWIT